VQQLLAFRMRRLASLHKAFEVLIALMQSLLALISKK
jgi:hypothetical protein